MNYMFALQGSHDFQIVWIGLKVDPKAMLIMDSCSCENLLHDFRTILKEAFLLCTALKLQVFCHFL